MLKITSDCLNNIFKTHVKGCYKLPTLLSILMIQKIRPTCHFCSYLVAWPFDWTQASQESNLCQPQNSLELQIGTKSDYKSSNISKFMKSEKVIWNQATLHQPITSIAQQSWQISGSISWCIWYNIDLLVRFTVTERFIKRNFPKTSRSKSKNMVKRNKQLSENRWFAFFQTYNINGISIFKKKSLVVNIFVEYTGCNTKFHYVLMPHQKCQSRNIPSLSNWNLSPTPTPFPSVGTANAFGITTFDFPFRSESQSSSSAGFWHKHNFC